MHSVRETIDIGIGCGLCKLYIDGLNTPSIRGAFTFLGVEVHVFHVFLEVVPLNLFHRIVYLLLGWFLDSHLGSEPSLNMLWTWADLPSFSVSGSVIVVYCSNSVIGAHFALNSSLLSCPQLASALTRSDIGIGRTLNSEGTWKENERKERKMKENDRIWKEHQRKWKTWKERKGQLKKMKGK